MEVLLRERHEIRAGQQDDFRVNNITEIAETAQQTTAVMTLLLGSIAAVSLVVGGIGIMNIMLVSVTERTREIGVRMALGARRRTILTQFLIESGMLTATGGVVGVFAGYALARVIGKALAFSADVQPLVALGGMLFSAGIGVFFGLYPALRASKLDPIAFGQCILHGFENRLNGNLGLRLGYAGPGHDFIDDVELDH